MFNGIQSLSTHDKLMLSLLFNTSSPTSEGQNKTNHDTKKNSSIITFHHDFCNAEEIFNLLIDIHDTIIDDIKLNLELYQDVKDTKFSRKYYLIYLQIFFFPKKKSSTQRTKNLY